jgi:antibiotic biosynthesis monooxygenase (ABM) superfamily enzyme
MSTTTTAAPGVDESVTVVTSRRVRPGCETAFEEWLDGIGKEAAKFPGLLGRRITRPQDHARPEYVVVFKFDRYEHLCAWTESPVRAQWLEKAKPLCVDPFKETVLSGLETWFTLPAQPGLMPPPRYKMAIMSAGVVYPLSFGLNALLRPVLSGLPAPLASLLLTVVLVVLMTWVVMPRVTRLFQRWLYPPAPRG